MENILPHENVTKFLILKKEYSQCNMVHDNAVIQYENIAELASNDQSFRDRADRAKRQVEKLAKELLRLEQEIKDLNRKSNMPFTSFTPLKNPIYGTNEIIEPTKIQFLPKINAKFSSKISTLWQSLTPYTIPPSDWSHSPCTIFRYKFFSICSSLTPKRRTI